MSVKHFREMDTKLQAEFHPAMNGGLRADSVCATSTRLVWWQTDGMVWVASPYDRSRGAGSPFQVVKK
jgi:hypothetical protein